MADFEKLLKKMNSGREFRNIDIAGMELRAEQSGEMIVEGYATTFEQRYLLCDLGDYKVYEEFDSHSFDNCDVSDVIFQFDHSGRVPARTRNKTLEINPDVHGLHQRARLGGTELGRQLFEEIKGGYIDRMSLCMHVSKDERTDYWDDTLKATVVIRRILEVDKLYDVSAVSRPANEATEISARSFADGVIEELKAREQREADKRQNRERMQEEIRQLLVGKK